MDRRRGLAVGGLLVLVLLAGCGAAGSLEMERATADAELADLVSRSTTPPEAERERVATGPTRRTRAVVRRTIENGSATARSYRPLVEPGPPFAHDGRYYNLSWTVVARQPGTAARFEIDLLAENETVPRNDTVAYAALSARDREVLAGILPPAGLGGVGTYNATERNRSVLLSGEYDAVRYEGQTFPYDIEDTDPVTIKTYRYTATVVANSSAAYARQLRAEYLFTLSGLSAGERKVVEEAIADTYYAEETDDEAFQSLLETFQQHEAITQSKYEGTWLVRYDDEVYLSKLDYGGFVEE